MPSDWSLSASSPLPHPLPHFLAAAHTPAQVLSYAVACTAVSAFSTGFIDGTVADEVMNSLRQTTEESQQVSPPPRQRGRLPGGGGGATTWIITLIQYQRGPWHATKTRP